MKARTILIYTRYPHHYSRWLGNLARFFKSNGFTVQTARFSPKSQFFSSTIPKCHHVFVWNGEEACYASAKSMCREHGIPLTIAEVGYFPQSAYYILDRKGINANSELMSDRLDWVSETMLERADGFASNYLAGRRWSQHGLYILCPLQLENDTNIRMHSPFRRMQQFVEHVEGRFPGKRVLFKTHPRAPAVRLRVGKDSVIVREGNILDLAVDAEAVIGLNSTSLLETTMMGVPTTTLASGLLNHHKGNERRLLAALIDKQVPVSEENVGYWLQRYAGFTVPD